MLKEHQEAIGWSLANIKGIKPSMCMHQILLEGDSKPKVDAQRRLNPSMKEVVRKEVLNKLEELCHNAYESSIIYKEKNKVWHDRHLVKTAFKSGQQVLLFN